MILIALLLGLVPDRRGAIREGRAALAESIAVNVTEHVFNSEIRKSQAQLELIVDRNAELESAALRRLTDSRCVAEVNEHDQSWTAMNGEYSSDTQVLVPIYKGNSKWGHLELRFVSSHGLLGLDFSHSHLLPLILFLCLASFIVFYFYLGKMLKHLDPSRAIPQRVRSALDTMAEGLLVVDRKCQIVLANSAISEILGLEVEDLVGKRVDDFSWRLENQNEITPWGSCLKTGEMQRNVGLHVTDSQDLERTFHVNCTPIATGGKLGGALISFR